LCALDHPLDGADYGGMTIGTLFTADFLTEGIATSPAWREIDDGAVDAFAAALGAILDKVADPSRLDEAKVEERIVRPILEALGWQGVFDVQTNLERRHRANVSDYSFFRDEQAFARADALAGNDAKLKHAVAVGDAKAWSIGLDQRGGGAARDETPAGQAIRYLTRAEAVSDRAVRYAILTNGRHWRLYWAGAKSLLDDYFEVDLEWALARAGAQGRLGFATSTDGGETERRRLLKTFLLVFRREAFSPSSALGGQTFHEHALTAGRLWETKVRTDLAAVVFKTVYPGLVRALAAVDKDAPHPLTAAYLAKAGEAALTLLYRLLFALYAEDRDLLPPRSPRYERYSLSTIRDEIAEAIDGGDALSRRGGRFWDDTVELFRIVDEGDDAMGVPPYNGGLFSRGRAPLLDQVRVGDALFAPLLDRLSRTDKDGRLVRINFRDLSVRELGAIYEGLLEYEPVPDPDAEGGVAIRLNAFGRKSSGSYYTPDELVALIIERSVGPLVAERVAAFKARAEILASDRRPIAERLAELETLDPATKILELKVCDPAMGSGHFLVSLIDFLAERVFTATGDASAAIAWAPGEYASPVLPRLAAVRERILAEAREKNWTVRPEQLSDQNLIKRFVLKRCVFGVDKNPMAVELAKVALWLHTFTAGAPLSFLDHHLRCGDSLFGERVRPALDDLAKRGGGFISDAIRKAEASIAGMETVESLTDAEVAEVRASAAAFADVEERTRPLTRFLDVWQALKWLATDSKASGQQDLERGLLEGLLTGSFGPIFEILAGTAKAEAIIQPGTLAAKHETRAKQLVDIERRTEAARELVGRARALADAERFLHWEVAFPGVWRNWQSAEPEGGFDAVIGNPPWDRMKMQEVEWFAARAPHIARQPRAADRKALVAKLKKDGDPLADLYAAASARAETAMARARRGGDYPLLSRGDINIYSLFVERAQALIKPTGIAGLLTPSGIASDLTASAFFKGVAAAGRVLCLFDFENRGIFFPDVHNSFKFCTFIVGGPKRRADATECGFFLRDRPEATDPDKLFWLTAADFALVNPNTGTAPIFRTRRDADLTTAIYRRLPVLVDRSDGTERKAWQVKYLTMFHMTNDSGLFWTRARLEAHGAYPAGKGRWRKGEDEWLPLYEGKMVQMFDHRAADVTVNASNLHRPSQPESIGVEDHGDPHRVAVPQYWIGRADVAPFATPQIVLGFKEITAPTNERAMIAALLPSHAGFGNTLPLVTARERERSPEAVQWAACFNSFVFDYLARSKIQGQHLNWFIVEQLPVVPPEGYRRAFGPLTAGEIVRDHVLRLTYTAWDMEPFAKDLGHDGPPFRWDERERRHLRARLDALYFHLYGVTAEDDIRYILSTFPIVERKDREAHGTYLARDLILWYFRALAAGDPHGEAPEAELIRHALRRMA
jgi:hypothetical protein